MHKRNLGNLVITLLLVINVLLWLVFPPVNDGREHFNNQWLGEILSTSALILMATAIFLANRPRYLEPYFGGLDRMYLSHRQAATLGLTLVLAHFLVITLGRGFSSRRGVCRARRQPRSEELRHSG